MYVCWYHTHTLQKIGSCCNKSSVGTSPGIVGKGLSPMPTWGTGPCRCGPHGFNGNLPGLAVHVDSVGTSPGIVEKGVVSRSMATNIEKQELVHRSHG